MNWLLRIRPQARAEMIEAAQWYSQQDPDLARQFTAALNDALRRVHDNPLQYQMVHGELRRARLHHFPQAVMYSVTETQIVVLGCIHGRRDPRHWMDRT